MSDSGSGTVAHSGIASVDVSADASKRDLMDRLGVDHAVAETSDRGLLASYQKYKAVLLAEKNLLDQVADRTWKGEKPTKKELIELFVSNSMWHSHYIPNFTKVSQYPLLQKWLEDKGDRPSNFELWGFEKATYNFKDLSNYLAAGSSTGTRSASNSLAVQKEKGKKKEKVIDKVTKDSKKASCSKKQEK